MAELYTQAEQTKGKLAHVEQEEEELKTKVADLENNLKNSSLTRLQELQVYRRAARRPSDRTQGTHPRTCRLARRSGSYCICFKLIKDTFRVWF